MFDSYGTCTIYCNTMNQIQKSEYKRIKDYLKNYMLNDLDQKTHLSFFYKARNTFICYLKCANYKCSSKFTVTIDQISTKKATLAYRAICENCVVKE